MLEQTGLNCSSCSPWGRQSTGRRLVSVRTTGCWEPIPCSSGTDHFQTLVYVHPPISKHFSRAAKLAEGTGLTLTVFYLSTLSLLFKSSISPCIPEHLFSSQSLCLLSAFMLLSQECLSHIHHLGLFSLSCPASPYCSRLPISVTPLP